MKFRERLSVGTEIVCKQNTYIPDRVGSRGRVKKGKHSVILEIDGKPYHIQLPTRKSDLIAESESEITYRTERGIVTWALTKEVNAS